MALKHALARPAARVKRAASAAELLAELRDLERRAFDWSYDYPQEDVGAAVAAVLEHGQTRLKELLSEPAAEAELLRSCAAEVLPKFSSALPASVASVLEAQRSALVETLADAPGWVLLHRKGGLFENYDRTVWRQACVRWSIDASTSCMPAGAASLLAVPSVLRSLGHYGTFAHIDFSERPDEALLETTAALASGGLTLAEAFEAAQAL